MTLPERHCEVVIAGGGMVGMTLAAALTKAGLSVVLLPGVRMSSRQLAAGVTGKTI